LLHHILKLLEAEGCEEWTSPPTTWALSSGRQWTCCAPSASSRTWGSR